MSSPVFPKSVTRKSTTVLVVIVVLALFVAVSALPRYVSSWPWSTPLKVPNQTALQAIRDEGITLPNWQSEEQLKTKIGGDTWSIQQLTASDDTGSSASQSPVLLLLRPQVWEKDQPEVEWLDLKGSQGWQTDSHQSLPFEVARPVAGDLLSGDRLGKGKTIRINTAFFRAWSQEQTYAVLQWYASPTGGSASPAWWFWADQKAQWTQRQRLPWVAVSIWLPIAPLSELSPLQDTAIALGQSVQTELLQTVFPSSRDADTADP